MKFKSDIEIQAGVNAGGSTGDLGQILSSTGTGVAWIDQNAIGAATDFVFFNVKNETGSTILKGKGVMAVGTDGNSGHILVDEMVADGTVEPKYFLGVLEEDIANGAFARVISFGQLDQFDTRGQNGETWADGQVLWCDPANNGDFTITEPDGPNVKIAAAFILNSSTNGKIQVRVQANEGVHDLHDTKITSQVDGDVLVWDNTTGVWFNDSTLNVDYTNGRVGIGTTNPGEKLEVLGNIRLRQSLSNAETVYISTNSRGAGTNDADLRLGNSNNGDVLTVHNANVGIGTTSPGDKLTVSGGDIRGTESIFAEHDIRAPFMYDLDDTAFYVNPNNTSRINNLNVIGDATVTGTINASNFSGTSSGTNTGDQDLSGYALIDHNHDSDYVNVTGDTMTGTLRLPWLWSSSDLTANSFYVQRNSTEDGFAFGIGTGVSTWFSWDGGAPKRAIDVWNDGSKILLGSGGHNVDVTNNLTVTGTISASNFSGSSSGTNTGDQDLSGYQPVGSYVTTDTTQTVSGAKTFSSGANHYKGHLYYDPYDANGNHYPHFLDGGNANGVNVNWRLYSGSSLITHTWNYDDTNFVNSLRSTVDMRAPVFYDSDNTGYYLNPASSSKSAHLRGHVEIITEVPRLELNDFTATNTTDQVGYISYQQNGTETGWIGFGSGSNNYLSVRNTSGIVSIDGDYTLHNASSRAPIFYDSNNTSYYLNPASTSNLNELDVKAVQRWYRPGGTAHQRVDARLDGSDQARLHWYGKNDAGSTANFKHAWYDGSNYINVTAASSVVSFVNTGAGYTTVTADGDFRAPIFYDSDNTGYYLNPASTSNLNAITSQGTSNFRAKRHNFGLSSNWDAIGFGNATNLHMQGHNQFWIGAGNGTWFTGTANAKTQESGLAADASNAHDLLITTMQGTSTNDRGITFAVDTNGAGTDGWRLGKWHSSTSRAGSLLAVDGTIFAKGGYTDEYDYYSNDYSAYHASGKPAWAGDTNSGWHKPSLVASSAIHIQSGNAVSANARKPQIQFHQYGYGGPGIEYDGPNKTMTLGELGTSNPDRINTFKFRFDNTDRAIINSDYMFHNSDMRAPLFYDSNNTLYYLDPAANSNILNLTVNGTTNIGAHRAYKHITVDGDADTYYPVVIGGSGGYGFQTYSVSRRYNDPAPNTWNTSTHRGGLTFTFKWSSDTAWGGNHKSLRVIEFGETYSTMLGGFALARTGGVVVWLRGGGARYTIHAPNGNAVGATPYLSGFTDGSGTNFPIRTTPVTSEWEDRWPLRGDNSVLSVDSAYANIYYDRENTSYYLDPTTSGTSAVLRGNIRIEKGNSTGTAIEINSVRDSSWPFEFTSNDVGNDNPSGFWVGSNGYPDMRLRRENSTVRALISSWERSYTTFGLTDSTDMRAPIFYDSNNTVFYVDPASTSQLNYVDAYRFRDFSDTSYYLEPHSISYLNDIRPNIMYDRNDTTYYVNPASTTRLNSLETRGTTTLGNGNGDTTRINDILELYATDSGDSHFYFGENSSGGYGTYWNWDSGYRHTWYSRHAGTNTSIMYHDTNDTGYLHMARSIHLHNRDLNYVNQLHFNSNVRFYQDSNDSYLNFKYGDAATGGIKFLNGGGSLKGYVYADNSGFGLLDNDGAWALRTRTGTDPLEFRCDNNLEFSVYTSYTLSHGSSRAPIFYDSNNTSYYVNPASTSIFNVINTGNLHADNIYIENGSTITNRIDNDTVRLYITYGGTSNRALNIRNDNGSIGIGVNDASEKLEVSGNVKASNFILSSDETLKENVKDLDVNVDAKWRSYKFKNEDETRYGVIAQELEETNPELVKTDEQGLKSVKYIDLLIAKIAELEARLEKLEK